MPRLNAKNIQTIKKPGMHSDGDGLYLHISKGGAKSWILRATVKGRKTASGQPYRVEVGLGSAALVSLKEARDNAVPLRRLARDGINPLDERRKQSFTFEEAAKKVHSNLTPTWRSEAHAGRWLASLERYAFPHFGNHRIDTITSADILRALEPIWTGRHDTAKRVMQRLSTIFDWAKGAGHYPHENPVSAIRRALPTVKPAVIHMPALPWQELPDFMSELAAREGTSARALAFLIHTAARSGEVRGARWSEFDFENNIWTVPAERMKTGKAHRVPLGRGALQALSAVEGLDGEFVFPSASRSKKGQSRPLSDTVFKALMDRMKRTGITTHGFRSTFRDWASEFAHADREVSEAALSHTLGNRVERAYARSDLFERRRKLMERWDDFCAGVSGTVVRLGA